MANPDKVRFVLACRQTAALFGRVLAEMRQQHKVWIDRGYAAGQGDPITAPDIDDPTTNVSVAEVAAYINAADQLAVAGGSGWVGTGSPTTEKAINEVRNDL